MVTESSPLSASLEELFLGRVRALPEDTQMLVLLAAADSSGEPALVRRAAERLRIGINAASAPGVERRFTPLRAAGCNSRASEAR